MNDFKVGPPEDDDPDEVAETPEGRAPPGATGEHPAWKLLSGASPREILARINEGDPLELKARCEELRDRRAMLVDLDRLHLQSAARVAYVSYRDRKKPRPDLGATIEECISKAIDDIMREDTEDIRCDRPAQEPWDPRFKVFAKAFGCNSTLARNACLTFNLLPDDVRRAYWAIVIHKKTVNRYVAEGNGPPKKVHKLIKRALLAMATLEDPGPDV